MKSEDKSAADGDANAAGAGAGAAGSAPVPGSPEYLYSDVQPAQRPPASPFSSALPPKPASQKTEIETKPNVGAMVGAIVLTLVMFAFLFYQVNKYFPKLTGWARSFYSKLVHPKTLHDSAAAAETRGPLAKITTVGANAQPHALNIHGVMSNGPKNLVLINDQVYQEGDEVDGVKILKINLDSIRIINNGQEETIQVTR